MIRSLDAQHNPKIPTGRRMLPALLLGTFLAAGSAWASAPRIAALGGAGDYFEDERNALRWYGSLADYPDRAELDFGHFNLPWGWHAEDGRLLSGFSAGGHYRFEAGGAQNVVGLYGFTGGDDADPGSLLRESFPGAGQLILGRRIGPVQATAMYRRFRDDGSAEFAAPNNLGLPYTNDWERRRDDYGLGLRLDLSTGAYLDLAAEARVAEEKGVVTAGSERMSWDRASRGSIALRGRGFVRIADRLALSPAASYLTENLPEHRDAYGTLPYADGRQWRLGCGLQYLPDPDRLLLVTTEYRDGRADHHDVQPDGPDLAWRRDWRAFTCTLGTESRFLSWLTLRGSMGYENLNIDESWLNGVIASGFFHDVSQTSDTLQLSVGAGLHLGRWDLDLALSEQEPAWFGEYMGHDFFRDENDWLSASLGARF